MFEMDSNGARVLFGSVSNRKRAVKRRKSKSSWKDAKRAKKFCRKAGEPNGSIRTSEFRACGLTFRRLIDGLKFNRKKVPYSDYSSDGRKPNRHGSVLRPSLRKLVKAFQCQKLADKIYGIYLNGIDVPEKR